MKRTLASLLLAAALTLSAVAPALAADRPAVEPYGTPWLNTNVYGMVTDAVDRPEPKDYFYLSVNYDWLKDTELQPGEACAPALLETMLNRLAAPDTP